ncbi:class I SAM-dependent DNA methyltransferase [Pseudonocardia humida]|uniref:site-specific DNA-methyltransferase (adenine-specific) n=1 Tax=Pseudonocardia humida TaxID=2800819 RepID=A0ABT1A2X5_9PSEU|nr:DNA methyltransferase [Pseudonocardia humida]MCO1657355.1 class I SAM-dependent DNA methyltransferase [Pseudonocardia humida]
MSEELVAQSEKRNYGEMFRLDLNWGAPDLPPIILEVEHGETLTATNVSSYRGLRVWEVPSLPGTAVEAKLDQLIAKTTTNRLVIFHEEDKQAWRWPSRTNRGAGVVSRPARHVHKTGTPDPRFAAKLDAIRLPDDVLLDVNAVLTKVRSAFDVESQNESKRASKLMAKMYGAVERAYASDADPKQRDHEVSVILARILFLLFGDDTDMWAADLFQDFIKDYTARDGQNMAERFNELFQVLNTTHGSERQVYAGELAPLPYVNGGIFEEQIQMPEVGLEFRDAVLEASAVDWSTISPAIFGSMFQSVRDSQTRRELGEHYTSEENILKTLNPLFLDELRTEFDRATERDTPRKQANALNALWSKLGDIRYLDPACGCGNFIIVAYRELRAIELDIMVALQTIDGSSQLSFDPTLDLKVTLDSFFGIEIDEWPAKIAETAMFLVDRQCDLRLKERFGEAPQRLPISRQACIVVGNALRLNWSEICSPTASVIVAGNPPFIGARLKSQSQAMDLQHAWGADYDSDFDLVTGWYAQAMTYFGNCDGRWAFVSTSSVSRGASAASLFAPLARRGWKIKFAHRIFAWSSEAAGKAAVHCVIVGFAREVTRPRLFDYRRPTEPPVELRASSINAYLVDAPWVLITKRRSVLSRSLSKCDFGSMANDGGNLLVDDSDLDEIKSDSIAVRYLRRFVGSDELINGKARWCLWLVDASRDEIQSSAVLRRRVAAVRDLRLRSKRAATNKLAATPHLFGERRQPETPYLGIPRHVSESRRYFTVGRFDPDVICGDANFAAADPEGLLFAILSSSMFMTWQRTIGGRIKSDLRFSNTMVWNNLPLPLLADVDRAEIISAGRAIVAARQLASDLSLSQQYDPGNMADDLQEAHGALDSLVDRAFGSVDLCRSDEERQSLLFKRYAELARGVR